MLLSDSCDKIQSGLHLSTLAGCQQSHEFFTLLQLDTNDAHDFPKTGEQVHLQDQQTLHLEKKGKELESKKYKWH
jgi:hypothetical protein